MCVGTPPASSCSQLKEEKDEEAGNVRTGVVLKEWRLPLHRTAWDLAYPRITGGVLRRELRPTMIMSARVTRSGSVGLAPSLGIADTFSRNVFSRRSYCLTLGFSTCLP